MASVNGTINKTGLMLVILSITAPFALELVAADPLGGSGAWFGAALIGGAVVAIATGSRSSPFGRRDHRTTYVCGTGRPVRRRDLLPRATPMFYEGIVMQAVMLTVGTAFAMLMALPQRPDPRHREVQDGRGRGHRWHLPDLSATMGLRFFGMDIPYIHGSGMIGIGFSLLRSSAWPR